MAFVDGSWKLNANESVKAGIGGYVLNGGGSLCFSYSEPSISNSPISNRVSGFHILMQVHRGQTIYGGEHTHY